MWVLSRDPTKIKFTISDLQDSLNAKLPMSAELFNLGVRMVAFDANQKAKKIKGENKPNHYMNLSFSVSNIVLLGSYYFHNEVLLL